jgi:hypothetical protein
MRWFFRKSENTHNRTFIPHHTYLWIVYGEYSEPFSYRDDHIELSVEPEGSSFLYRRICDGQVVEKLLADNFNLTINPVSFRPIILKPGSKKSVYLTFPIEIGVLLGKGTSYDILDIFSLCKTKYSLYGTPEAGLITRWHESKCFDTVPVTDRRYEGVLLLTMENQSSGFIEVSRAILSDYGMQIWYGECVSLICSMKIFSHSTAETLIINRPVNPEMKSSIPLYVALKIPVVQRKGHFMEHGLS